MKWLVELEMPVDKNKEGKIQRVIVDGDFGKAFQLIEILPTLNVDNILSFFEHGEALVNYVDAMRRFTIAMQAHLLELRLKLDIYYALYGQAILPKSLFMVTCNNITLEIEAHTHAEAIETALYKWGYSGYEENLALTVRQIKAQVK